MLSESTRKDMDHVEISVLAETFLQHVLGRSMINVHGAKRQKDWKKIIERLTLAIEKAIQQTVVTDAFHLSRLNYYVARLRKASRSSSVADIDVIFSLTGIILELLGGVPDHRQRKRINMKGAYFLNNLRTLGYCQDLRQKVNTILEASRHKPYSQYHKDADLFDHFANELNWNSSEFIEWYKKKYPEVYVQLF